MKLEIFKYETEEEASRIKAEKEAAGFILVEVQNITEGNFLGFQEIGWTPPEPEETQVQRLDRQLADQDARLGDVELGLAEIFAGGGD